MDLPGKDKDRLTLKGRLILADPSLRDPNFVRTVILMTEHDASQGAHGYVLNRPLGKHVGDVVTTDQLAELADVPVYLGGPVSPNQLAFTTLHWDGGTLTFETHLAAEVARQRHAEGFDLRAFVGYSGWSGGQLESELEQRAWIPRPADDRILVPASAEAMWSDLLSSMSPWHQLLAGMPDDPSLN